MIISRICRDWRHAAACGGVWLHMAADRPAAVLPGQTPFVLILRVPPAGFEPATHGLGMDNRESIDPAV
jgi:hypothetical protein